jgi:hypothetical protein
MRLIPIPKIIANDPSAKIKTPVIDQLRMNGKTAFPLTSGNPARHCLRAPSPPSFPRKRESSSLPPDQRAANPNSKDAALRAGEYALDSRFRGNDGHAASLHLKLSDMQ